MPGYPNPKKTSVNGGSIKKTKVSKVSKAKKSNKAKKSKKVKRGGSRCGSYHAQHMKGGASCGSHNKKMNGGASCGSHNKKMNGGFIRDGSPQNLMMRVSDKKKCKN